MYCAQCDCRFSRWSGRCPVCGSGMVDEAPSQPERPRRDVTYAELVQLTADAGGKLTIPLSATDVAIEKKWRFPYDGYGYAWVKRLQGVQGDLSVDLRTTDAGRKREHTFPYLAFGFAWAREMQGTVGKAPVTVTARDVQSRKSRHFPWLGRGFAWTSEWSGACGAELQVEVARPKCAQASQRLPLPWVRLRLDAQRRPDPERCRGITAGLSAEHATPELV